MKARLAIIPLAAVVAVFALRRSRRDREFEAQVRAALHAVEEPDPHEMAWLERREQRRAEIYALLIDGPGTAGYWAFAEQQFGQQPRTIREAE